MAGFSHTILHSYFNIVFLLFKILKLRVGKSSATDIFQLIFEGKGRRGGGAGGQGGVVSSTGSCKAASNRCPAVYAHKNPGDTSVLLGGNPGCSENGVNGAGGGAIELKALSGKILIASIIDVSGQTKTPCYAGGGGGTIRLSANEVEVSGNGKLIADGANSFVCKYRGGGGGGGIIHIIANSSLHLDVNAISVRGGPGHCSGSTGFILVRKTTANQTKSYTKNPVYPTEELHWSDTCKDYTETLDFYGNYYLKKTKYNKTLLLKCKYGPSNGKIEARCMYPGKETVKAQWKIGNHEKCWKRNEALANYAKLELTTSNVLNITSDVKRFTKETNTITSSEIGNISKILENIANVDPPLDQSTVNSDFVIDFYNIINNVLNVNETILINSQKGSDSSNSIIKAVKNFTERWVFSEEGQSGNFSLPNIAVSVANVSSGEANNVTAYADDEYFQISSQPDQIQSTNTSLVMTLSKEVFNQDTRKTFKVLFILYRKTLFFKATDQLQGPAKIRGFVIAASVREKPIENIDKAVVIRHSISAGEKAVSKKLCVFWDFEAKQHRGDWSTAGCKLTSGGNYDECHCNHLTNFALLLDFEPDKTSKHQKPMSIISYIGCSLSLLGIALTLCTMIYFRELLASKASKIFFFVCVTLGAALIVFVAAAERRKTATNAACIATGIMIHHLVISSLAWMSFEALTLYCAFVKVLPKAALEEKLPSLKICCLVCWGIPGIIVSITAGVTYDSYSNREYCFLQGLPMVVAFFVPVTFFVVVNTIAFIVIVYRLLTSGTKVRSTHRTSRIEKARRGLAISVFLGLTWISGVLALRDAKVVFQYVFCIVNSLQGLLIFLFYCVFSTEVRKKIRTRCCGQPPLPAGRGGPMARMEMRAMRPAFEEVPGGIDDIAAAGNVAEESDECPPD